MTAEELLNLGSCGVSDVLGMNTEKGCPDLLEATEAIWLLRPSVRIAATDEVNAAYIKSLQKSGDLVIIQGISTFAETGNDDAVETLEDDTMVLTNQGKYKFTATFAGKGLYYNRALAALRSHEGWRAGFVDKKGDVFWTHNPETGATYGFKVGMLKNNKLQPASNAAGTKSGLDLQLLRRYELDEYYVRWDLNNLDFDPRLVEPITQVFLSLASVPADTDTTIDVIARVERGRKDAVTGFAFGQWLNTTNGATNNPTAGDDSITEGTYLLTGLTAVSAGDVGTIRLYDNSNNSPVVEVADDGLYRSNVVSYTVTA